MTSCDVKVYLRHLGIWSYFIRLCSCFPFPQDWTLERLFSSDLSSNPCKRTWRQVVNNYIFEITLVTVYRKFRTQYFSLFYT